MKIIKRDGREVEFDQDKIYIAVEKAAKSVNEEVVSKEISDKVTKQLENNPTVEEVQDLVEFELMKVNPKTAKAYILYREEKAKERKKKWDMTDLQRDILDNKYRDKGESFDDFIDRVSGNNPDVAKMIRNKDFLYAGRILAGRGISRNVSLSNCYVLPQPDDNIESIYDVSKAMARTYSYGGGTGTDLSRLRPAGSPVNNAAKTSVGPVPFMQLYDTTTKIIGQEGRRGALMLTISSDHPDARDFIEAKQDVDAITHANISVRARKDLFDNSEENNKTLKVIAEANWRTGEPGLLYWDRVEDWHLLSHHPEYELRSTNPCVVGDTLITTADGIYKIKDLVGREVDVYTMDENEELAISKAYNIRKTQEDANLVKVITTKGEVICTPDHEFYTRNRGWVEARDLEKTDKMVALNRAPKNQKYTKAYLTGSDANKATPEHRFVAGHYYDIENNNVHHIDNNPKNNRISNLEVMSHSEHSKLTNEGHEDWSERCEDTGRFVEKENKKEKDWGNPLKEHPVGTNMRLLEVVELDYTEDVYDMTVEGTHNYIANNVVIHNCGEQPLPEYGSCNLGSINLGNFVLNPFTDEAEIDTPRLLEAVKTGVVAMNEALDDGMDLHPLPEQREVAQKFRQIGLGIMGLADMYIKLGVRYGSEESMEIAKFLAESIRNTAFEKSVDLVDRYGTYPAYDYDIVKKSNYFKDLPKDLQEKIREKGMANSHVLSIAPTGSISTMIGVSGGIEPIFANSFTRTTKSLSGKGDVDYKVFTEVIKELMDVKGIEHEKDLPDYCITSHDLNPEERIEMQSIWQTYIDSAISSTLNLDNSVTVEEIEKIYRLGYEKGLKGITVFRDGSFREGILNVDKDEDKEECPECGGQLVMQEGCNTCVDCGWSACSF